MEEFIQDITKRAGKLAMEYFGKVGVKYTKSHQSDVVTEADLAVNEFLIQEIKNKYPDHGIISEETGEYNSDAEWVWVIDPIDGTLNFATKAPLFCIMVGLMQNKQLKFGCVNCPAINEFYYAKEGQGAYLNGERVFCATKENLDHTYGCSPSPFKPKKDELLQKLAEYGNNHNIFSNSVMCMGIALCWAAAGKRDWVFVKGAGGLWDYVGPMMILQESGCRVTNYKGEAWKLDDRELIAANPVLHSELLKVLLG